MTQSLETLLVVVQGALLAPLALFGLHRGWMVWLRFRSRRATAEPPAPHDEWPHVTVQLPIYNERLVAARLVERVARLDYPRDRLEIQVLDDSTDDTSERVRATIAALPRDLRIEHVRRSDRTGFKAGALEAGVARARGEFFAVFDADFLPPEDFLTRTIPHLSDPSVGLVQARWGHVNPDFSVLTDMQRTLLDGHFVVEHRARAESGCFFNFNGTAGVFRRSCIQDAGGWQHDTLTEDMDLSYRAQLRGWKFVYLPELVCPAELPIEMNAFLGQQHRWAKGSIQTGRKLLGRILRAPISLLVKVEACFHLLGNVAFPLLLGLIVVALPLQILRAVQSSETPRWLCALEAAPLLVATLCVFVYYGVARVGARTLRLVTLLRLPLVLALGAGMCVNNTAAVLSALRRDPGEFNRTPKRDVVVHAQPASYRCRRGWMPFVECGLAIWAATTALTAFWIGLTGTGLFHALFATGLAWTGVASLAEDHRRVAPDPGRRVLAASP